VNRYELTTAVFGVWDQIPRVRQPDQPIRSHDVPNPAACAGRGEERKQARSRERGQVLVVTVNGAELMRSGMSSLEFHLPIRERRAP
jgi:hypothetical protein